MTDLYKKNKMRTLFTLFLIGLSQLLFAQHPVSWQFQVVKKGEQQYDIVLKASIQPGWHLYSQQQPDDAIAIPTSIQFNANPLLMREKDVREEGKLEKYKDKTLGVTAHQFSGQVSFIQSVKLKAKVKTAITGEIEYQVCDDEKCLPPKKVPFTIVLNG
ncbi:MAG: protein-disulfide reductase DsbD domain-containing protein [Bacteroidota bacterium]